MCVIIPMYVYVYIYTVVEGDLRYHHHFKQ